jgi:hypothetical protein
MTKSVEELEREFAREVRRFIDMAIAEGHSLQEAKAMARDVVARIAITLIRAQVRHRAALGGCAFEAGTEELAFATGLDLFMHFKSSRTAIPGLSGLATLMTLAKRFGKFSST